MMSPSPYSTGVITTPRGARSKPTRVLIVANQTATSRALIEELKLRARGGAVRFHLVVPALESHLQHWLSDTDPALRVARERCEEARSAMAAHGISVTVEVGDSVPMHAIADALSHFRADEILISTLPASRSHWLERDLIGQARRDCGLPVTHVTSTEEAGLAA